MGGNPIIISHPKSKSIFWGMGTAIALAEQVRTKAIRFAVCTQPTLRACTRMGVIAFRTRLAVNSSVSQFHF